MPDETRAADAYAKKLDIQIVEARLNALGAIVSVNYGAKADTLVGYETAVRDTLATLPDPPSVLEQRYYHEFSREAGAKKQSYSGGVLGREYCALRSLWESRGLDPYVMDRIAGGPLEIYGGEIAVDRAEAYRMVHNQSTTLYEYFRNIGDFLARCAGDEGDPDDIRTTSWARFKLPLAYAGASLSVDLIVKPTEIERDRPADIRDISFAGIEPSHPTGFDDAEEGYNQSDVYGSEPQPMLDEFTVGTETRIPGITVDVADDGGIEICAAVGTHFHTGETYEDRIAFDVNTLRVWIPSTCALS